MVFRRLFVHAPEALIWSTLFVTMVYLSVHVPLVGIVFFLFVPVIPALHSIRLSPFSALFWNAVVLVILGTQLNSFMLLLAVYYLCVGIGAGTGLLQLSVITFARYLLMRENPDYQAEHDLLMFSRHAQTDGYLASIAGGLVGALAVVVCWPSIGHTSIAILLENIAEQAMHQVDILGVQHGIVLLAHEAQATLLHIVQDSLQSNVLYVILLCAIVSAHVAYHVAYWAMPLVKAITPPRVRLRYARLPSHVLFVMMASLLAMFFFRKTKTACGTKRSMHCESFLGFTAQ